MRSVRQPNIICTLVVGVLLTLPAAGWGQPSLPEAQQAYADGDFREALRIVARAMSSRQLSVEQRSSLLMLRGESLLRLGERMSAAESFTQAANLHPGVKETALGRATAALVRRSPNNAYRPQTGVSGEPIDIINPDSRRQAFAAMFSDTQASLRPRVQAALRADTLPPIIDVLQPVFEMGAMEYQATGSTDEARQTLTELGEHARGLMSRELRRIGARMNHLIDLSNSITDSAWGFNRRGLQVPEVRELREMTADVRQIAQAAQQARARARELGFDGAAWEPIICDAFELADRGAAVLGNNAP